MQSVGENVGALSVSGAGSFYEDWSPWGDARTPGVPSEICGLGLAGHQWFPSDSGILHEAGHTAQPDAGAFPL